MPIQVIMKQLIGTQIGQYQVEALLGEGGMGAVYRAHDLKHDRMVALKIMLANLTHKPQFRSRFMQEAESIAHFSSPAIVTVYDTGTYEEAPYIIMEYIEGGSLINYMRQLDWSGTKPTVETIITIAAQVAEGLSYAHQRGLIHRDIKPGNVLLKMRDGAYTPRQAIITDFGLAIQQKDGDEMDTAPFMGSLAYMSPEQCENKTLDGRSDIYALGILLYQLTTGQLPFKINAPADIVKHLEETPLPPSLINPHMPEILETITLKAMEKKPGNRYQSAAEMAHALRQALTNPDLKTAVIAQDGSGVVTQWLDNKWVAAIDVEDRVDIHQTWTSLGKNRLFIVHQYEESQIVGLEKDEFTIGREPTNDIVLDDQSVSGKHLRLTRTPQGWNVSDVGSTNHTYLGERMLEYEQTYNWPSDESLRVGPYFLRWQPFEADHRNHDVAPIIAGAALAGAALAGSALLTNDPEPNQSPIAAVSTDIVPEYSDGEILGIAITPPVLELDPGAQNLLEISITNRDVTVKDITLRMEVEGRPPSWVTLSDNQMKLLPDETQNTTALVDLLQAPDILAGSHLVKLIATTDKGELEFNEVAIAISSQEDFGLDMHPSNLQEQVTCRLTISDQSNFQNEYTIMGIDDSDALEFDFDEPQNAILAHFDEQQQQIKVLPRQEAWMGFRIRPRKRPLFGSTKTMPFKIRVRTPETDWQSLNGQVEISPRITRRILLLLLLLLLIIGGIGAFSFYSIQGVKADYENQLKDSQSNVQQAEAELAEAIASGASEEEIAEKAANVEEAQEAFEAISEEAAAAGVDLTEEEIAALAAEEAEAAAAEAAAAEEEAAAATAAAEEAQAELEASFTPTPEPNNPPTGIEFSASSITENIPVGTVIGEFTATDPDSASAGGTIVVMNRSRLSRIARQSEEFTFELVSGSGDTHNDYFAIEDNQLVTTAEIDFEEIESLSFRVKVTDAAGDSFEESFTLSVTDSDDIPQLSISDVTVSEADGTAEITVSVSGDNYDTATVDYATGDGTAVAGTDYTTTSGSFSWDKDDTDSQTITVPLLDNEIDQADRTFVVTLSNANNATIDSGSATITIIDDDDEPTLTISDLTVSESVTGGKATVTVELTGASSEAITVDYATTDGTATAGTTDDYVATSGTLSWAAEATGTTTFDITINTDDIDESEETVIVTLSNSTNAAISDSEATITISDDNDAPRITIGDVTLTEGDTQISVPVTMTGKTSEEAWVEYSTSNGNGTTAASADYPDPDFDSTSSRLTWDAGDEGVQYILIQVNDDDIDEVDQEFFVVSLYDNSSSVALQDTAGNIYINDDDDEPTISLENLSSSPVSESAATVEAAVTVDGRSSRDITLYYSTQNDTATAGEDYTAVTNGSLTWSALDTTAQSIRLTILDDETDEDDEEIFVLTLNSADNAQIDNANNSTNIVLQDDDDPPVISASVSNNGVDEDVSDGQVIISVDIDRPSTQTITVTYTTVDGTAVAGDDFTAETNDLTWNPGEEDPFEVIIDITDDEIFESDEEFTFRLENVSASASIGTADTTVEIRNDDPAPIITIDSISPALGLITEASSVITVTIVSDRQSSSEFQVDWATAENSGVGSDEQAASGIDFTSGSGTAVWPADSAASTTQSFSIILSEDDIHELDESFLLNLTSTEADIDDTADSTTITIIDNDNAPTITIGDLSEDEDDITISIPVTMTGGSYQEIAVPYTITNGTATSGSDYNANATGVLTWTANTPDVIQYISLDILEDAYDDDDETILIDLGSVSPSSGATILNSTAILTINDDDLPPELDIGAATVTETDSGTVIVSVPVTLTGTSESAITVDYYTDDSAASTTATAGSDYTAISQVPSNTLTWAADTASPSMQTISLSISGDEIDEGTAEYVQINLANATTGTNIATADSLVTITDDDDAPNLAIGSETITEGDTGTILVTIPVTMTGLSAWPISVDYATANVTASAGTDYDAIPATTLTWVAGISGTQNIIVTVNNDTIYEGTETLDVGLSNNTISSTITTSPGTITILDNEIAPELDILATTVTEGDSGTATATVSVTLSSASEADVTVRYHTADDTATTADNDYDAIANSSAYSLTWSSGNTTDQTFTVTINGDGVDEGSSEQFSVNLSDATNATINTATASVTITDDDDPPQLSVGDASITEGNSGSSTISVPVSMSGESDQEVTVAYYTSDDTATVADGDYDAIANDGSGVLTWAANDTSTQNIVVTVNGDTVDEPNESFFVHIITPTNATINTAQSTVTINDNDNQPSLAISGVTVTEGDSGTVNALVSVSITGSSASAVTVQYYTADDTATTADSDYVAIANSASNILTWNSGDTSDKTFNVTINGDTQDEGSSESLLVNLTNAMNAGITTPQASVTITDDDGAPSLSFSSALMTEGDSGTTNVLVPVSISGTSAQTVTVQYYTSDDTATTADNDYVAIANSAANTLTWSPGDTADKSFSVTVNGDYVDEGSSEQFYVNLGSEANATISTSQASVMISDDDTVGVTPLPASLTLSETVAAANNSGTFTITLDSEPTSGVRILLDISAATNTECSISSPASNQANFTTVTWNTGIPITVAAETDTDVEGTHTCEITMAVANNQSADEYDDLVISNFVVTILDDD